MRVRKVFLSVAIAISLLFLAPNFHTDKELSYYENQFLAIVNMYCDKHEIHLPPRRTIMFEDLDEDKEIGYCSNSYFRFFIGIDRSSWNSYNYQYRYQLMFHELTHCYLQQEHIDFQKHYMYPYLNNISTTTVNEQLIDLLKEKCDKWKQ